MGGACQKKNSYTHEKQGRRSYGCSECSCTHNKNVMSAKVYFCAQKIKTVVLQRFGYDFDGTQLERRLSILKKIHSETSTEEFQAVVLQRGGGLA